MLSFFTSRLTPDTPQTTPPPLRVTPPAEEMAEWRRHYATSDTPSWQDEVLITRRILLAIVNRQFCHPYFTPTPPLSAGDQAIVDRLILEACREPTVMSRAYCITSDDLLSDVIVHFRHYDVTRSRAYSVRMLMDVARFCNTPQTLLDIVNYLYDRFYFKYILRVGGWSKI